MGFVSEWLGLLIFIFIFVSSWAAGGSQMAQARFMGALSGRGVRMDGTLLIILCLPFWRFPIFLFYISSSARGWKELIKQCSTA